MGGGGQAGGGPWSRHKLEQVFSGTDVVADATAAAQESHAVVRQP